MDSSRHSDPLLPSSLTESDALVTAAGPVRNDAERCGSGVLNKFRATRSAPELALATRAISVWYQNALGYQPETSDADDGRALNLDDVIRQHTAMRREWERREATYLAASLSQTYLAQSVMPVSAPYAAEMVQASRRTALLIDASPDNLVTIRAFLQAFGLTVTVAADAEAALQILASTPVDLLVTDHAMPGMTGKDLVAEALQDNPALRAMIITGFPQLPELANLPPGVQVLAKPFRRAELFRELRASFKWQEQPSGIRCEWQPDDRY